MGFLLATKPFLRVSRPVRLLLSLVCDIIGLILFVPSILAVIPISSVPLLVLMGSSLAYYGIFYAFFSILLYGNIGFALLVGVSKSLPLLNAIPFMTIFWFMSNR